MSGASSDTPFHDSSAPSAATRSLDRWRPIRPRTEFETERRVVRVDGTALAAVRRALDRTDAHGERLRAVLDGGGRPA